jgi:universal protein Kae1
MNLCLGIESTAHTFGASVVSFDGEVLSNVRDLFTTESGGLIPAKLADHHVDVFDRVVSEAIEKAGISFQDIDLVAFSQSPGMGHSLRVGLSVAKSLSLLLNVPLIGVNHCIAHLEIGRLKARSGEDGDRCSDPVLLYASGANTQVIAYEGKKYRVFGETLDNGIGNFIDGFARYVGLGFPGGPKVQELAKKGSNLIDLPYSVKGMDVSFSGMQTRLKQLFDSGDYSLEDLSYSLQEYAFAMLLEVSERAMAHTGKTELLLGGGVACNTRLQEMARKMCADRGAKCFILPNEFNVDNAAMIAWTGILQFKSGQETDPKTADIEPYLRTDDVEISWRD